MGLYSKHRVYHLNSSLRSSILPSITLFHSCTTQKSLPFTHNPASVVKRTGSSSQCRPCSHHFHCPIYIKYVCWRFCCVINIDVEASQYCYFLVETSQYTILMWGKGSKQLTLRLHNIAYYLVKVSTVWLQSSIVLVMRNPDNNSNHYIHCMFLNWDNYWNRAVICGGLRCELGIITIR